MTSKTFIWYDGEYWKFKHQTLNKAAYQSKSGQVRIFSNWQIKSGHKEYQKRWPKDKEKIKK